MASGKIEVRDTKKGKSVFATDTIEANEINI